MIDYKKYFVSEKEFNAFVDYVANLVIKAEVINGINYITDSIGRKWTLANWTRRGLRTSIANDLLDNTIGLGEKYDQDLYFSSYLSDSSQLCINYQNKIYSISGTGYPKLENALWRSGGGLIHPNCRHLIEPYFEGLTKLPKDTITDDEISKNYIDRQNYLKYRNKYREYKKKYRIAEATGNKELGKKYRQKAREWQRRKNNAPLPIDSAFDLKI